MYIFATKEDFVIFLEQAAEREKPFKDTKHEREMANTRRATYLNLASIVRQSNLTTDRSMVR